MNRDTTCSDLTATSCRLSLAAWMSNAAASEKLLLLLLLLLLGG
jgi:hypothetical protein